MVGEKSLFRDPQFPLGVFYWLPPGRRSGYVDVYFRDGALVTPKPVDMKRLLIGLCVFTGLLSDPWAFWTSPVSLLRFINTPTEEHLQPLALHAHNADAKGTSHAHGETAESPFEDRY